MNILKSFHDNQAVREAFKDFQLGVLREMAADMAIEGESTDGIKDAVACVNKTFDRLSEVYGKIQEPTRQDAR